MGYSCQISQPDYCAILYILRATSYVILGKNYTNYRDGLKNLNIENLNDRREQLCFRFAKNCLKNEKVKDMFPNNSAIPYMVDLLNRDAENRKEMIK